MLPRQHRKLQLLAALTARPRVDASQCARAPASLTPFPPAAPLQLYYAGTVARLDGTSSRAPAAPPARRAPPAAGQQNSLVSLTCPRRAELIRKFAVARRRRRLARAPAGAALMLLLATKREPAIVAPDPAPR